MKRMLRTAATLLAVLLPTAAPAAWTVSETTLDNGLKVIVREDHRAPVVVSQVWYRVGSSYEQHGVTGISHVLEHMMFKGTKQHGPGEFSEIISRNGGRQNAFTGRDYTTYFEQLSADRLGIALELEADRMHNLLLDPEQFDRERQVVMEERRLRTVDKPVPTMIERFHAVAYPVSPYGHPVIGWVDDLKALNLDDLEAWYRTYYVPSNATLVVCGDVDPERVFSLARKYFGPIPAGEVPPSRGGSGLTAPGERRITVNDRRADVPFVVMGYGVPSGATAVSPDDVYALMVLATVLDGGQGARLAQSLVRDQGVAASAGAGYDPVSRLDDQFTLQATPAPGHDPAELERALRGEVARLQDATVSHDELQRAKNQLLADHLFGLDSTFYQAMQIGMLETTGIGWKTLRDYEPGVRGVTPGDIQRVARQYLTDARLTVGVLRPQPDANTTHTGTAGHGEGS